MATFEIKLEQDGKPVSAAFTSTVRTENTGSTFERTVCYVDLFLDGERVGVTEISHRDYKLGVGDVITFYRPGGGTNIGIEISQHFFEKFTKFLEDSLAERKLFLEKKQAEKTAEYEKLSKISRGKTKFLGAKALTDGSKKQKAWAETIRAEKIESMTEEQIEHVIDERSICRKATFWIKNREKTSEEIAQFAIESRDLVNNYNLARENNNVDDARELAKKYNSLTEKWGFR